MTSGDKIAQALFDALSTTASEEIQNLKDELDSFSTTYHRSYIVTRRIPMLHKLILAMEEAVNL